MTTELKDLYLAQCEQWIIGQRSAAQYLLGINDIYGWMICVGSKLQPGVRWAFWDYCDDVWCDGQTAKDAHLDELRRGLKRY